MTGTAAIQAMTVMSNPELHPSRVGGERTEHCLITQDRVCGLG